MTPPTYREIVIAFGGLAALIGRMADYGIKISVHIECSPGDEIMMAHLMRHPDSPSDPKKDLTKGMTFMGIKVTWGPKQ